MSQITDRFEPGQKVCVTQQIPQRDRVWTTQITGTVEQFRQQKTGSWFARSRHDKLWLDRLVLRKADGEIVTLHLDPYTHVQALDADSTTGARAVAPGESDGVAAK